MRKLSILLTNNRLGLRAGTEGYVQDVAVALLRRGHRPVAFSPILGTVAEDLHRATVPVIDDIARLAEPPDVIHGHHHFETLIAALAFPSTPIVHFCHGWVPWEEMPLRHPSIRRYVAVDDVCRDRLVREEGIPPERVDLVLNFVDLERFQPRVALPARPARALVFSHQATEDGYVRMIRSACASAGIALDVVGGLRGNPATSPETLLPGYDVVFAKARAALEAMAVGCAVVLTDAVGAGPLVTPDNFAGLRANNFGVRELREPHTAEWYAAQLSSYSAGGAGAVSGIVRSEAGLDAAIDRLLSIYASALAEPAGQGEASVATVDYLQRIAVPVKQSHELLTRVRTLSIDLELARGERDALAARLPAIDAARAAAQSAQAADRVAHAAEERRVLAERERMTALLEATRQREHILESQVDAFRALPTVRVRDALLRIPVVGPFVRTTARQLAKLLT